MNRRNPFEEFEALFEEMRRSMLGDDARRRTPVDDGRWRSDRGVSRGRIQEPFDRPAREGRGGWARAVDDAARPDAFRSGDTGSAGPLMGSDDATATVEPTDDGYVFVADLPGFGKEDIQLRVDEDVLTVVGGRDLGEEGEGVSRRRRRSVREQVRLPPGVLADEISASYRNGVLQVDLPTDGDVDGRRIDVD